MGIQIPIIAIQNNLSSAQQSVGLALVIFGQTFGGALFLSFGDTVFSNGLANALPIDAPQVNAQTVIEAGASAVRQVVSAADLDGVLEAYSTAIDQCFYLAAGASVAAFVASWGMGWVSIKQKKVVEPHA